MIPLLPDSALDLLAELDRPHNRPHLVEALIVFELRRAVGHDAAASLQDRGSIPS
jgi:hypothetical protein